MKQFTEEPTREMHFKYLIHIAPGYRHSEAGSKRATRLATGKKIPHTVEMSLMAI